MGSGALRAVILIDRDVDFEDLYIVVKVYFKGISPCRHIDGAESCFSVKSIFAELADKGPLGCSPVVRICSRKGGHI
jgi:hypothetical protein